MLTNTRIVLHMKNAYSLADIQTDALMAAYETDMAEKGTPIEDAHETLRLTDNILSTRSRMTEITCGQSKTTA
jgi:hypothetical protein